MTREIFSILAKFSTKNMIGKVFLNGQFFDTIYDPRNFFQKCPNCQQKYDPVNLFKKAIFQQQNMTTREKISKMAQFSTKYDEPGIFVKSSQI